jgi:hypothetical protein
MYQIRADPTTLDGIQLTLGDGSVEAVGMTLTQTSLLYTDGNASNTIDKTKVELVTENDKTTVVADSLKVSNSAGTQSIECKKDRLVVLDTTNNASGQSTLAADDLVFTSGGIDTLTLDDSQLLSTTTAFNIKNTGSISLEAPVIMMNGVMNISSVNASTGAGPLVNLYIRVNVSGEYYKIPLHMDYNRPV